MARANLPTGTVTFLFTDVEGSTRLLAELGSGYADAVAAHRRVLRKALARWGGVEVDTQGDAFFVAFARASEAVAAAEEAQAKLSLPVRIGIHTGEPEVTDEGYVGLDVHRAARICAVAHGGQVVISGRTLACVHEHTQVALRDLGLHRLKDLAEPVRLYQLGDTEFPPLRSLNATNLPVQPNPLVGRERELAEVTALVRDGARLVNLTGPGGAGKTRLALQAAAELVDDFPDGVFWVSLAALRDPELVVPTIEETLGAAVALTGHVGESWMLLLLDNFEQLLEAGPQLAATLDRCPNLKLLVTSRALLRLAVEREYSVPPLPAEDAVALFRDRAVVAEPLEAVREVCRRLDGLPLAIELAAARTRLLPPDQLLERLERALPVLTGGRRDAPERQRTLRATIEWSYELLLTEEQELFRRLGVFAGGFVIEAAEATCDAGLETLESLLEKSLVRRWASGRLGMLQTIREFAEERLKSSGELNELRRRHTDFFLSLANATVLSGGEVMSPEELDTLRPELGNFRAAFQWSLDCDPVLGLRLAVALEGFWPVVNPIEGMRWLGSLLERTDRAPVELRARALRAFGGAANPGGRDDLAERAYSESLDAFLAAGDEGSASVLLLRLGYAALYRGDTARARSLAEESLAAFRAAGNRKSESTSVGLLGEVEYAEGAHDAGLELMQRSASLAAETGLTWWRAGMLGKLADKLRELGRCEEAEERAREALALSRGLGDRLRVVRGLARLARLAAERGEAVRAGTLWGAVEAEEERGRIGAWENERQRFTQAVLAHAGDTLQLARDQGRALSLDAAVRYALRGID